MAGHRTTKTPCPYIYKLKYSYLKRLWPKCESKVYMRLLGFMACFNRYVSKSGTVKYMVQLRGMNGVPGYCATHDSYTQALKVL